MSIRGVARYATVKGEATPTNAPLYVDSDDNKLKMIPAGSGTTEVEIVDASSAQTLTNKTLTSPTLTTPTVASSAGIPYVADVTGAGGYKIARGSGSFVSGAVTIATGLATVTAFACTLLATGFATGATEITNVVYNVAPATGAVALQGYRLMTTTASASGTGVVSWIAIGT